MLSCRPEMNMARLLRSAQRLMLAEFDPQVGQQGEGHGKPRMQGSSKCRWKPLQTWC